MRFVGRITGEYNSTVDYIRNKLNTQWVLYNSHTKEDMIRLFDGEAAQNAELDLETILMRQNSSLPYVQSSAKLSNTNKKLAVYGNESVLNTFLNVYQEVLQNPEQYDVKFHTDSADRQTLIEFTHPVISLQSLHVNEKYTSIKKIKGMDLDDKMELAKNSNSRLSETLRSMNHLTLEQIGRIKDLSWCMDTKTGKLTKDYEVVHTMDRLRELMKELANPLFRYVAVDSETTGLKFNALPKGHVAKDIIVGMSLTWKLNQGIYIPFDHTKFQNVPKEEALKLIFETLKDKRMIAHNGMFDIRVFADEGVTLKLAEDTQILAFHLNPTVSKGNTALKKLTLERYGHETIELDDIFPSKNDAGLFKHLTLDIVQIYACADTDYTYRLLFDMFKGQRTEDDGSVTNLTGRQVKNREGALTDEKYKILSSGAKALYAMDIKVINFLSHDERYGNRVDVELLTKYNDANNKDLAMLEEVIYKYVGQLRVLVAAKEKCEEEGLTEEQTNEFMNSLKEDPEFSNLKYDFKIASGTDLAKVMYDELKYPIYYYTSSGRPATDKFAFKELLREDSEQPARWLKEDLTSALVEAGIDGLDEEDKILVRANVFESKKYPLALLIQKWKDLEKLRTSFFANLLNGNTDGWYFSGYRFTSAETARIINPIQTLKGALKRLILPYSKDYYMFVFDYAAIEYRTMAYESKNLELIKKLNDPETDYHREVGASMMGTTPEDMTKAQRGDIKAVNFAVPYGMGAASLGANLARQRGEAFTPRHKLEAEILLEKWKGANHQLYSTLTAYRQVAVERGIVTHAWGRSKTFDISPETMDNKARASIERQAGNYPIQALARDIFAMGYLKLKLRLEKEGHLTVREETGYPSVITPNLVHDEMVSIVHKSIHPYQMYQYILEECMLQFKGHPIYFAGINVVNNWYEGKADKYEAPIRFVWEKVEDYKSNPDKYKSQVNSALAGLSNYSEVVLDDISEYMLKRYRLELFKLSTEWTKADSNGMHKFDLTDFMDRYKDYFLKPKMRDFIESKREFNKKNDEDTIYALTESLVLDYLNPTKVIFIANGVEVKASEVYGDEETAKYSLPTEEEIQLSIEAYERQKELGQTQIQDIEVDRPLTAQTPELKPLTGLKPLGELPSLGNIPNELPSLGKLIPLKLLDIEENVVDIEQSLKEDMYAEEAFFDGDDSSELSVPVYSFKANRDELYTIKDVDPSTITGLADVLEFTQPKQIVKSSKGFAIVDFDDNLVINVDGVKPSEFKLLHEYLTSLHDEKGNTVVYSRKLGRVTSNIKVKNYDKQKVADILNVELFSTL